MAASADAPADAPEPATEDTSEAAAVDADALPVAAVSVFVVEGVVAVVVFFVVVVEESVFLEDPSSTRSARINP